MEKQKTGMTLLLFRAFTCPSFPSDERSLVLDQDLSLDTRECIMWYDKGAKQMSQIVSASLFLCIVVAEICLFRRHALNFSWNSF